MRSLLVIALVLAVSAPAGAAETVASGIPRAANLAFDPAGGLWVTGHGGVWHDGRRVISGLDRAQGLAWHAGELYVSFRHQTVRAGHHDGRIDAFGGWDGTRFTTRRTLADDLPSGIYLAGGLAFGPEQRLYVGAPAKTRAGRGALKREGTILSISLRGGRQRIEARGLAEPYGLAFLGSRLYVTDRAAGEVNSFDVRRAPAHFGWPRSRGSAFARVGRSPSGLAITADGVVVARSTDVVLVRPSRKRTLVEALSGEPRGVALGPDGNLYAALHRAGRVVRLEGT